MIDTHFSIDNFLALKILSSLMVRIYKFIVKKLAVMH